MTEDGAVFSEAETAYFLDDLQKSNMPNATVAKLETMSMTEYINVLGRKLKALIENQQYRSITGRVNKDEFGKGTFKMETGFSGKVVMVTGASRGIGREIAWQFAERGACIVVPFHKNHKAAEQTLQVLCGNAHLVFQTDLYDASAVSNMTEQTRLSSTPSVNPWLRPWPFIGFSCMLLTLDLWIQMAAFMLSGPEGETIRAQNPLNRVARPAEVAWVVPFLASEGTDYLTGSIIDVNAVSYLRT